MQSAKGADGLKPTSFFCFKLTALAITLLYVTRFTLDIHNNQSQFLV